MKNIYYNMKLILNKWEDLKKVIEFAFLAFYNKKYRSRKDRWSIFKTCSQLYLLSRGKKSNQTVDSFFFNFKIRGFNPESLLFLYEEIFLSKDYNFKTDSTSPVIIDCGSNIGVSILFFKMIYPRSIIHAFEPNPKSFELLKYNIENNNLKDVYLNRTAVSEKDGFINLFSSDLSYGSLTTSINSNRGGEDLITVPSIKLSNYIKKLKIDLIKIDVEGAEVMIIKDLITSGILENYSNYIVEYHHNISDSNKFNQFLSFFEEARFSYNIKASLNSYTRIQDLLIYFNRES